MDGWTAEENEVSLFGPIQAEGRRCYERLDFACCHRESDSLRLGRLPDPFESVLEPDMLMFAPCRGGDG
jgi:hypothetical protein